MSGSATAEENSILRVNVGFVGDVKKVVHPLPMHTPVFIRYQGSLLRIAEASFSDATSALILEADSI